MITLPDNITVNIILLFSYLSLSAEKKGTIEMLIKGWEEKKILCDKENNTHMKQNFCIQQYQLELALKTKGLCKGAHSLKLENDTKRDNQLSKDQVKAFEKINPQWIRRILQIRQAPRWLCSLVDIFILSLIHI